MTYRLIKVLRGYQPIYVKDNRVFLYRRNRLYTTGLDLESVEPLCELTTSRPFLSRFAPRLMHRVLRLGVTCAEMMDDDTIHIVIRDQIFVVDLTRATCTLEFTIPDGRRALNLALLRDDDGQGVSLAFGEYFNNPKKVQVRIWRRSIDKGIAEGWMPAATFPSGTINHVHALCQDADGTVRVLTGDFGDAAAMWITNEQLSEMVPLLRGSQAIRACWLRRIDGVRDLCFATDSQFEPNSLSSLAPDGAVTKIAAIEGSSIYSAQSPSAIYFSSTVEPGDESGNLLKDMIERRPGPGIVSTDAVLYRYSAEGLEEISRSQKDIWPMRLAQFGTYMFPQGVFPEGHLYAFGSAVRGHDGATLHFERNR